jgi:hypothetical protein
LFRTYNTTEIIHKRFQNQISLNKNLIESSCSRDKELPVQLKKPRRIL